MKVGNPAIGAYSLQLILILIVRYERSLHWNTFANVFIYWNSELLEFQSFLYLHWSFLKLNFQFLNELAFWYDWISYSQDSREFLYW